MSRDQVDVAVVGAGPAGLCVARRLQERGLDVAVLEAHARPGDGWRERYASLRLFSPRWASSLPGYRLPIGMRACPSADRMADYLDEYAARFALPVRPSIRVLRLGREEGRFVLDLGTPDGPERVTADRVVVAAGAHRRPVRPPFASQISASVRQLHSLEYHRPADLAPGPVLVVGAGNSGTDIALEAAAAGHPTVLAGRHPGQAPVRIDTVPGFLVGGVILGLLRHLTVASPVGRAAKRRQAGHGLPLIRNKVADLDAAGVRRTGRIVGVEAGLPVGADGDRIDASTIVWCTGSRTELSWIDVDGALDEDAQPRQTRGIADAVPGLGFVGLDFQYSAASSTIQGMDRDARHVVRRLLEAPGVPAMPARRAAAQPLT
ncbi:MAG TPA: NAD(P)/FAD-dependent oxidoreductase [Amnibacterium sp.]|nr:NAD(P)/FAD-dependent oxidoreductase [Amnibacterium sp.]